MITVTDLFCGAGGSSSGAEQVPGVRVRMAANHWSLAIETHNTNLPHADHDCAEISQVDPRRYPRTDILWASPECTNHSQAKGQRRQLDATLDMFGDALPDAAAERSRATMWDVIRFAEHHRYRAVIVENVVDAYHWAPFKAWLLGMDCLGYDHQLVWLNSMHAQAAGLPAPQSRDRMYVVFWRKADRRPDLNKWTRPRAWCPSCAQTVHAVQAFKRPDRPQWGRYRSQYLYRCPHVSCRNAVVEPGWLPAGAAIDWSLPGQRIGDKPIRDFYNKKGKYLGTGPLAPNTLARIEAGLRRYAKPFLANQRGGPDEDRTQELTRPTPTVTASGNHLSLLVPVEGRQGKRAASADEPMRTQTARNETALLVPAGGTWNDEARPVSDPFRTRTTRDTEALVIPMRANKTVKTTGDPLDTIAAAANHHALVMRNNNGGAEMSTPVDEVIRTITTKGHQSLIRWDHLVVDYNGPARPVSDVLPTQTTVEGDGHASLAVSVEDCLFRMLEPTKSNSQWRSTATTCCSGTNASESGSAATPSHPPPPATWSPQSLRHSQEMSHERRRTGHPQRGHAQRPAAMPHLRTCHPPHKDVRVRVPGHRAPARPETGPLHVMRLPRIRGGDPAMSVRVMSWLWEHSTAKGSELLLLLAIADCADDHGRNAWPSIDTLADKTRMHRRSVQRIIQQMVADGLLEVDENGGRHGTNNYTVILSESNSGSNFEHSEALSTGVAERQGWQNATVASDAPRGGTGATRTIQNHPLPPNPANAGSGCPAHHHPSPNCRGCGTNPRALQKAANIAAIGIACGNCGPGRLIDLDDGRVVKCPHCHPNRGIA